MKKNKETLFIHLTKAHDNVPTKHRCKDLQVLKETNKLITSFVELVGSNYFVNKIRGKTIGTNSDHKGITTGLRCITHSIQKIERVAGHLFYSFIRFFEPPVKIFLLTFIYIRSQISYTEKKTPSTHA